MPTLEFVTRFSESRKENKTRSPAVVVLEFGGGSCNKAGEPSCRDFCAVPNGKAYNPLLDPSPKMLADLFSQVAKLKPAVVSIVPNGEGIDTKQQSNTSWDEIFKLAENSLISQKQLKGFLEYYSRQFESSSIDGKKRMSVAEKMAITIALVRNDGLNLSLTTNGSFLTRDLLKLYSQMGLQTMNLSYHPNKPFDPSSQNPELKHLITRAKEAIEEDIVPTITHVLTSKNASTFVALSDFITERNIFFSAGIANTRGGGFSTGEENQWIEPTNEQIKTVFLRLLARKLFADRSIRTTIPYLLIAPYLNKSWVCDQATDFFHISISRTNGKLQPNLNVCSEVRPTNSTQLVEFLKKGKLNTKDYLEWRKDAMEHSETGCKTCIHQCFFEAETRGGLDFNNPLLPLEICDYWDTLGKGLRQKYTFKKPIRPIISHRKDLKNPYLWESLLQGVARQMGKLAGNNYWQETFKRSGVSYDETVEQCTKDALDQNLIAQLIDEEERDWQTHDNWHDANNFQSRVLRSVYLQTQRSAREGGITVPLKFKGVLKHEPFDNFQREIKDIVLFERKKKEKSLIPDDGIVFPELINLIRGLISRPLFNLNFNL